MPFLKIRQTPSFYNPLSIIYKFTNYLLFLSAFPIYSPPWIFRSLSYSINFFIILLFYIKVKIFLEPSLPNEFLNILLGIVPKSNDIKYSFFIRLSIIISKPICDI